NAPTSYLSSERANHRHLDSFPTRRSSDLPKPGERYAAALGGHTEVLYEQAGDVLQYLKAGQLRPLIIFAEKRHPAFADVPTSKRSEEHTSELQSLRHLVCRLLLEKKKHAL